MIKLVHNNCENRSLIEEDTVYKDWLLKSIPYLVSIVIAFMMMIEEYLWGVD